MVAQAVAPASGEVDDSLSFPVVGNENTESALLLATGEDGLEPYPMLLIGGLELILRNIWWVT